jgi:hypothetical protein
MTSSKLILALAFLMLLQTAHAQVSLGDTKLNGGGSFTMGYNGAYGDQVPSSHGLDMGFDGKFSGYYYNPQFLSFTADPYWNKSRADSDSQSLTGSRGLNASANFFTGSNFPGSVSYGYDTNSTGSFGLLGQPDFTTYGHSQNFGVNWSALLPDLPTLTVGYSQGSGRSTVYGTEDESQTKTHLFNVRSNYTLDGFRLTGFYDHNNLQSDFPQFLSAGGATGQDFAGNDYGFGMQHNLPLDGIIAVDYVHSSGLSNFTSSSSDNPGSANVSNYADSTQSASANFHPTRKLGFSFNENYTDNLAGYLAQSLASNGSAASSVDLGMNSYSFTTGASVSYVLTNYLNTQAQATYYRQHFFDKDYTGQYLSGTLNYNRRLLNTFTFSATVIDSSNGQGTNAVGFIGSANFFRRFNGWQTSGQFSYAQNVQTLLITYTTSYYSYSANLNRHLPWNLLWISSFNGNHSGLTKDAGATSHTESYATSLGRRRWAMNGYYSKSTGLSILGAGGVITPVPTPGLTNFVLFSGSSYGGGGSLSPVRRLTLSGTFGRAISDTLATANSHNDTQIMNAQLQYRFRRIGILAGYTRFAQGISAIGLPVSNTSYFIGFNKWFDFF